MTVKFEPSTAKGKINAPPSKSITHRMFICASLAGNSEIHSFLKCDDTEATLNCLKTLGAQFEERCDALFFDKQPKYSDENRVFECRESASTLRFLIPLALVFGKSAAFTGNKHLIKRGIDVYKAVFEEKGISINETENSVSFCGKLTSGEYVLKGNVSSQFVSGLLMSLPLLNGDSKIKLIPPVESRPYIDLTISVLEKFGIKIEESEENLFKIKGSQKFIPCSKSVKGDWSNAAFLFALNYLGGNIEISGLNYESRQGDRICLDFFKMLDEGYSVIDISDYPDLGPILFAFAAAENGGEFLGTKRLRNKESDRIFAMANELKKFGIESKIEDNYFTVLKGKLAKPSEKIFGHNDHRIVMALSVLLSITGGEISGAEAVNKSYPQFFDSLKNLGINLSFSNDEEMFNEQHRV